MSVSKEDALNKIDSVISAIEEYRKQLYTRTVDAQRQSIYLRMKAVEALLNVIGDIDFTVQEVAEERFLFSNWSKRPVAKPRIDFTYRDALRTTTYRKVNDKYVGTSIRHKELIMPDVFEYDVERLEDALKFVTFQSVLSNTYLRADIEDSGAETFKDAQYKYFFFNELLGRNIGIYPAYLGCDTDTEQALEFCVIVGIREARAVMYAVKGIEEVTSDVVWCRSDPDANLAIWEGKIRIGTSPQCKASDDIIIEGYLVQVDPKEPGYDVLFADFVLPEPYLFIIRRKPRGYELLVSSIVDRETFTDATARQAWLNKKVWELTRGIAVFIPSTDVRIYDAMEWLTTIEGT